MKFSKTYQKVIDNNISIIDLDVAVEVNGVFGEVVDRDTDDFEHLCSFVKDAWLKDDKLGVWPITQALYDCILGDIVDEVIPIVDILKDTSIRDIIDLAYERYY